MFGYRVARLEKEKGGSSGLPSLFSKEPAGLGELNKAVCLSIFWKQRLRAPSLLSLFNSLLATGLQAHGFMCAMNMRARSPTDVVGSGAKPHETGVVPEIGREFK